jgi:hypothetical protein
LTKFNNFLGDLARGKVAEEFVRLRLEEEYDKVIDVRDDKEYRQKDIDFVVIDGDKEFTVEVKGDKYVGTSRRIFLETVSNRKKETLGCFLKSEADVWVYCALSANEMGVNEAYWLPHPKVKAWFLENETMFKKHRVQFSYADGRFVTLEQLEEAELIQYWNIEGGKVQ